MRPSATTTSATTMVTTLRLSVPMKTNQTEVTPLNTTTKEISVTKKIIDNMTEIRVMTQETLINKSKILTFDEISMLIRTNQKEVY